MKLIKRRPALSRHLLLDFIIVLTLLLSGCEREKQLASVAGQEQANAPEQQERKVAGDDARLAQYNSNSVEELVEIFCIRCHALPAPADLPTETWPIILDWMGNFVGIRHDTLKGVLKQDLVASYLPFPGMVPPEPLISHADYDRIRDYFISNAPTQAEMLIQREPLPELTGFEIVTPDFELSTPNLILGLAIDEGRNRLYVGSARHSDLSVFELNSGERVAYLQLDSEARDITIMKGVIRIGTMGMEGPAGKTFDVRDMESGNPDIKMLINDTCDTQTLSWTEDLNQDGLEDILSVCFGRGWGPHGGGRTRIYWQTPEYEKSWEQAAATLPPGQGTLEGAFRKTTLSNLQGTVDAVVTDFNNDTLPDIMVHIANGFQQLTLYTNKGEEKFEQQVVAEFPPSAGGMALTAEDFDQDGYPEVIVTTGNNEELEDLRPIRPYHGVYIFKNNGGLNFTQQYFFPLYGATRTVADDFDGDGDFDMAAVAFVPYMELDSPESFVYLENLGNWNFNASTLPVENWGRWINIAAGDLNQDGRPDIVLGDASFWPFNTPKDDENYGRLLGKREAFPPLVFLLSKKL